MIRLKHSCHVLRHNNVHAFSVNSILIAPNLIKGMDHYLILVLCDFVMLMGVEQFGFAMV